MRKPLKAFGLLEYHRGRGRCKAKGEELDGGKTGTIGAGMAEVDNALKEVKLVDAPERGPCLALAYCAKLWDKSLNSN